jgi:HPr kinase/phosphorylase
MHPPGIVVTEKFKYTNNLLKIAKRENVNVFYTNMASAEFTSAAETYISRKIAKYTIIHGAIVQIFGVGVLIKGESGVGKSELVMQLVDKGHIFIGDDAVDVARFGNILFGKTNKYADRFVEVKGLGMVDIEKVCGVQKMLPSCNIEMVIEIVDGSKQKNEFDRSRQQVKTTRICGINLPYYTVSRVAAIAENCVVDYKLRNAGHEPMINYNEHITNTEMEEK